MTNAQQDPDAQPPVREPSRFDAGDGQGTSSGPPKDVDVQERPILDGSTEPDTVEREVENPRRGMEDPGLIRHPEHGEEKEIPIPGEEP